MVPRVKMISAIVGGVDELLHLCAGLASYSVGRDLAELVNAAMDVGVFGFVVAADRDRSPPRLLRGGAVVEIDQRLAVDRRVQDGEIGADSLNVNSRRCRPRSMKLASSCS